MKIKLKPGGKIVVFIFLLLIVYLLIRITGLLEIFSSNKTKEVIQQEEKVLVKIPDRPLIVGYVKDFPPTNLIFANGGKDTKKGTIFQNLGLNVLLQEYDNFTSLTSSLVNGGDAGGIDLAYIDVFQFLSNYDSLKKVEPKAIILSGISKEKQYFVTDAKIKSIKDLINKKIGVNNNYSSELIFNEFAKKSNFNKYDFDYLNSDEEIVKKLLNGTLSSAILKDKKVINDLTSNKNYKILSEITGNSYNLILGSKKSNDEYSPYIKTFLKGCLKANDSLNKKAIQNGELFADKKLNKKFFFEKSKNNKTDFENEIQNIFENTHLKDKQVAKIYSSELIDSKYLDELLQLPVSIEPQVNQEIKKENQEKPIVKEDKPSQANVKVSEPTTNLTKTKIVEENSKKTLPKVKYDKSVINNYYMINFDPNSTDLDSIAKVKLAKLAKEIIDKKSNVVFVIGHADSTGEDLYNFIISKKRADTVKSYLSNNYGINQSIFKTVGKGSREPLGPNSDKKWKNLNRRVNIILKDK